MATLAEVVTQVRDNLYSAHPGERPFRQILATTYLISATTVTVPDGAKWAVGDVIDNEATGEQLFITGISTNVLTVTRGFNGTTAVAGALGNVLSKNPRTATSAVTNAVTAILRDLESHGVFRVLDTSISLVVNTYIYEIDFTDLIEPPGVIDVFFIETFSGLPKTIAWRMRRDVPTALSATRGYVALGSWDSSVSTAYVSYGARYTAATQLPDRLVEPVIMGATGRLIGKFIGQMLQDPGQHSNRTVPQGQASRDARWYQAEYITAVRREAALLGARTYGSNTLRYNRAQRWRG